MTEIALVTAGFSLIFSVLSYLWVRKAGDRYESVARRQVEHREQLVGAVEAIAKLTTALPAPRLIEMEGVCRALKEQYDQVVTAFEQHRAAVHRSIQRFDQIMRRDERAASVIEAAKQEADEGLDIDPDAEEVPETQEGDRSFLEADRSREQVAPGNGGMTWDERRRAMRTEYYENRGGRVHAARRPTR